MKDMNKLMASLIVGAVSIAAPLSSHAAFLSKSVVSSVASVTVGGGTASMSVSLHNVADNAIASAITWTGVSAGAGWTSAAQYIQITSVLSVAGAGIQTYTDNTAGDASPKYTGVVSSVTATPAGLVSTADTTQKLPTAWSVVAGTASATVAADPNTNFAWLFHEDKAQVAVPNSNAAAFVNGDPFVTVVQTGNQIHFAQGPTQFGGPVSPSYVYVESNFSGAVGGTTYKTSTLRLELFTQ